jgi:hypothetical protein
MQNCEICGCKKQLDAPIVIVFNAYVNSHTYENRASQKSCLAKDEGERLGGIGSEAAHGAADIGDA